MIWFVGDGIKVGDDVWYFEYVGNSHNYIITFNNIGYGEEIWQALFDSSCTPVYIFNYGASVDWIRVERVVNLDDEILVYNRV